MCRKCNNGKGFLLVCFYRKRWTFANVKGKLLPNYYQRKSQTIPAVKGW
jgi:hypothetical protein